MVVWSRPPRARPISFVTDAGQFAGQVHDDRPGEHDRLAAGAAFEHVLRHAVVFGDDGDDFAEAWAGGRRGRPAILLGAARTSLPIGAGKSAQSSNTAPNKSFAVPVTPSARRPAASSESGRPSAARRVADDPLAGGVAGRRELQRQAGREPAAQIGRQIARARWPAAST